MALAETPLDILLASADVDIVSRIDLPARAARYSPPPKMLRGPVLAQWVRSMTGRNDLRLHQSLALDAILRGEDVVLATGTASGKSLAFQGASIVEMLEGDGVVLALYPLKALASDQLGHWRRALEAAAISPDLVAELTGDTPMDERNAMLDSARIFVATADVIHSWLMRQVAGPAIRKFLNRLRYLIIDEAHVLEGEFGSNCAYFFPRLQAAQFRVRKGQADVKRSFQIIAATATIADPAEHLMRLTGRRFTVIDESNNGAPAAERTVMHIDGPAHGAGAERMLADLLVGLADQMTEGAFIAFHDSRQGVERITDRIDRDDVLPYRSGYEASDRRRIESALRAGTLRGVVATSSLELGIDIPQFVIGFNVGVPNSRKTFQQRLGRVGRSCPALFVTIAPAASFAQIGSSLEEFVTGSAEPSALYLSNPSVQFAQARCLIEECEDFEPGSTLPEGAVWPAGFDTIYAMAKPGAARPREFDMLAAIGADNPHYNYPLRHVCETSYALKDTRGTSERLGTIGLHQAIREAYPGATYRHLREAHKVREWRSNSFERTIRLDRVTTALNTMPLLRKQVNVSRASEDIIDRRERSGERGFLAELQVQVNESVEGYRTSRATMLYSELRKLDPRMTRKQRDFSSTGVVVQICEPWFAGSDNQHVQVRQMVASALKELLIREHCIQPTDIDFAETNVAIQTPSGPQRVDNAICIYDTIYGSLRLSASLFDELPNYVDRLARAASVAGDDALVSSAIAAKLADWYAHLGRSSGQQRPAGSPRLKPGEHLIFAPGSKMGVSVHGEIVERRLIEPQLLTLGDVDTVMYRYEANPGVQAWVPHEQLRTTGQDWHYAIWTPSDGRIRAIEEAA